jgi:hypothetical protein
MQRSSVGWGFFAVAVFAHAQTLSPREIFYGQGQATATKKPVAAVKPKPAHVASEPPVSTPGPSSEEPVVSLVSSKIVPLGLKYTVLKRGPDGQYSEVDGDSTFTAHDRIKVSVEVNDPGYLYVVAQGSSGIWQVLYPSPEVNGGDNRVRDGRSYSIPDGAVFTFDSRAGAEKLFLVLARQQEKDLESLIHSLRDKNGASQDNLIQKMRQTYSRDLLIEKVDDAKTPAPEEVKRIEVKKGAIIPPGEKAVYVINRNADENGRVVADVELRHQ